MQRRAEVAFRSLDTPIQQRIAEALHWFSVSDRALAHKNRKLHKLAGPSADKKLFSYAATPQFRLVLSFDKETCIVEDILHHDRLDRIQRSWD
jgi:hypothetical protein